METFRFVRFPVYQESKEFYRKVCEVCSAITREYALKDQISRASLSVILNIAEGSAKKSDKEFARFLEISIASMNEVVACLDVMRDMKLISEKQFILCEKDAQNITKQLGGFIRKIYRS